MTLKIISTQKLFSSYPPPWGQRPRQRGEHQAGPCWRQHSTDSTFRLRIRRDAGLMRCLGARAWQLTPPLDEAVARVVCGQCTRSYRKTPQVLIVTQIGPWPKNVMLLLRLMEHQVLEGNQLELGEESLWLRLLFTCYTQLIQQQFQHRIRREGGKWCCCTRCVKCDIWCSILRIRVLNFW